MNNTLPEQGFPNDDFDGELVLIFLTEFHSLEQALIRAGYTRAGPTPSHAQADWIRYARHIEGHFRPDSSPELQGAVSYLLCEPANLQRRRERLQRTFPGEISNPQNDVVWLSELVLETGNRLTHGINFPGKASDVVAYVTAALLVVVAFSHSDPLVESLLTHVQ